jgi:hypothetical protein
VWAAVGVAAALGALVIGPLVAVAVIACAVPMAARVEIRHSAYGFLTGIGLPLLYVAYAQREGPGTTCWTAANASGCDQHLNPVPWLVAGAAFTAAGIVGHARRAR